jgi:pyruvate formate lyase activating enzyme
MVQPELIHGTIFDIQGFSVHDGPGCRTLIFFKGCTLQCAWCSNPEGLELFPEPLYQRLKCNFDLLCVEACEAKAITKKEDTLAFDRDLCRDCKTYDCIHACCTGALKKGGYIMSLEELYSRIIRDRQYWGRGGGVSLTGGEPFLQPEFAEALLRRCYESYIHTVVETCGNVPWENIRRSMPYTDWIFYDIKHPDSDKHRLMTGAGNSRILENARRLAGEFKDRIVFRCPVIPGFNDDDETIDGISGFLTSIGRKELNILPLHHLGREKYDLLGMKYYTVDFSMSAREDLLRIQSRYLSNGINCYIGSDTPF